MVEAYLDWSEALGVSGKGVVAPLTNDVLVQDTYRIKVIDTFGAYQVYTLMCSQLNGVIIFLETYYETVSLLAGSPSIAASLVLQGLMPSAPETPTTAFTIRVVELYRTSNLRCPHLTIQPFVKSLCDLHGLPFRPNLSNQFSVAYDQYLAIREAVDAKVQAALEQDAPGWRLKHACPACTYKLKGEEGLIFDMLITMDGNDSLKRILRHGQPTFDEIGDEQPPTSKELRDDHEVGGDYYLSRERVDHWAKEVLEELLPNGKGSEGNLDEDPCQGRWKNMIDEITARMWGVFDETGIFLSLCHHGFVLLVADMIRSGELAKYPLAMVEALLDAFGARLGAGYDIGSFHGHAHNRLCQLSFLAKYIKGLGLEDLEGCERFFSKSNALASSTRHASIFHRKQKIYEFVKHMDKTDTYQALSQQVLEKQMQDWDITDIGVFEQWLKEERDYLINLSREPPQETLQMEYYQKLVNLNASQKKLDEASAVWSVITPETHGTRDYTASKETERRHALEDFEKDLKIVHDLEKRLSVTQRWTPMSDKWAQAAEMTSKRRYQQCLDTLEGLVVAQMFELTKMNMSQTGYKLWKHIGSALKARSQAICNALENYNVAAAALHPPHPPLSWDVVVEYAFLADFDLLADTRQNICERPWATPAAWMILDEYFKIQRAHEEIKRLNIEIRRFVTYMQDEEAYLKEKEDAVMAVDSALAHQITLKREHLQHCNALHRRKLNRLMALQGFTGILQPGVSTTSHDVLMNNVQNSQWEQQDNNIGQVHGEGERSRETQEEGNEDEDEEDTDEDEDNETMLVGMVHKVLEISSDV
ncbi:hypothetical protein C0992_007271 [Termitomyces sp. T32_za158]|nr:hypothetical protein C0992_007271 [Termitomyces sp. T32_za158]